MNVLLLQLDGKLPNLALMRLAAHHRGRGDTVTLRQCRRPEHAPDLFGGKPDAVYASLIFRRTRPVAEAVRRHYPNALLGGTGWDHRESLERHGIGTRCDYTDYPEFGASMGFTQRGCRLACEFCLVPEAEGRVRQVATVADIWRGEPWPRHLLLLDNDFFGQPSWRERIREIRDGKFRVSFNQGINARMLTDEAAEAIASVDYRDDGMTDRRVYTAWDNRGDEAVLFRGLNRLARAGVKPDHVVVYMLIGYWAGETEEDWLYRQRRLREFGCRPYPMPYDRGDPMQMGFQRWVVRRGDLKCSWADYKAARCRPEKVGKKGRLPLPLFPEEC